MTCLSKWQSDGMYLPKWQAHLLGECYLNRRKPLRYNDLR